MADLITICPQFKYIKDNTGYVNTIDQTKAYVAWNIGKKDVSFTKEVEDANGDKWVFSEIGMSSTEFALVIQFKGNWDRFQNMNNVSFPRDHFMWTSDQKYDQHKIGISGPGWSHDFRCDLGIFLQTGSNTAIQIGNKDFIYNSIYQQYTSNNWYENGRPTTSGEKKANLQLRVSMSCDDADNVLNIKFNSAGALIVGDIVRQTAIPRTLFLTADRELDSRPANSITLETLSKPPVNSLWDRSTYVDRTAVFVQYDKKKNKWIQYTRYSVNDFSVDVFSFIYDGRIINTTNDLDNPISKDKLHLGINEFTFYDLNNKENKLSVSFKVDTKFDEGAATFPVTTALTNIILHYEIVDNSLDLFQSQLMWGVSGEIYKKWMLFMEMGEARCNIMFGWNQYMQVNQVSLGERPAFVGSGVIRTDYITPNITVLINKRRVGVFQGTVVNNSLSFVLPEEAYMGIDTRYDRWPYVNFEK